MVWYGMYGMVWYGTVWYGMVWYGMVWYGMNALGANKRGDERLEVAVREATGPPRRRTFRPAERIAEDRPAV